MSTTILSTAGIGIAYPYLASGGAPPSNWYALGYTPGSGWFTSVTAGFTPGGVPPGATAISDTTGGTAQLTDFVLRYPFTAPAGLSALTLSWGADDLLLAVYVNGQIVWSGSAGTGSGVSLGSVLLFGGGNDVIALQVADAIPSAHSIGFSLVCSAPSANTWLVIDEPVGGYTDQTTRMFKGQGNQNSWSRAIRQRGPATVHMEVAASDSYAPTRGAPVYILETTAAGSTVVYSGFVQDIENQYFGNLGDRYILITLTSLESIFDTIYAQPEQYVNKNPGDIVVDLFNRFETGCPVGLGTIQSGPTLPLFNAPKGAKISDLIDQLATTSGFTWYVDPATRLLFFGSPAATAAPATIVSSTILWDTVNWKLKNGDYRNRQGVRLSFDAFQHSMEFFTGAGQQSITLKRPVKQVTNAYATLSTCNTATGSFSGQPSPGDTVTISPASGAWQSAHIYSLGGVIVINGYVQSVTTAGTSGGSQPTFSIVTGATTTDNTAIWTCLGPSGLATGTETYTFVTAIDNTQFGQVLIGSSTAATCKNLCDAINANVSTGSSPDSQLRGSTFSLPTWEGSNCNALYTSGTTFTLQQKAAGSGWVSSLTNSSSNFSWSATQTSGGTSPQGSLGPNLGATISLQVYPQGTSTAAPGLSFTEGSNVVGLATPLNVGSNLNVEYTRSDGDTIEVENTALVTALAAITGGTGKVQAFTDQSSTGLIATSRLAGLTLAQQILALYDVPPQFFGFDTYATGFAPGQSPVVSLTYPTGSAALLNGTWLIESVSAHLLPVVSSGSAPYLPGFGHWKYTLNLINVNQVNGVSDFWRGIGGSGPTAGAGGGGAGSGVLVQTSGGAQSTVGLASAVNVLTKTANYTATSADAGALIVFNSAGAVTLTLPAAIPFTGWSIEVQNIGAGTLTINRNGFTIDTVASNLLVGQNNGLQVATDGANWLTERGMGLTNPMTTLGDVIVGAASGVPARLGVGSNGKVLTANSSATNGIDFEAPIAITTIGTSGAAVLTPGSPYSLNIPQYSGGGGGSDLIQSALGEGSFRLPGLAAYGLVPPGGGSDQEWNSTTIGGTALGTATAEDANTTAASCYYVKLNAQTGVGITGRYFAWSPSAGGTATVCVLDCVAWIGNFMRGFIVGIGPATPGIIVACSFLLGTLRVDAYTNRTTYNAFVGPGGSGLSMSPVCPIYIRFRFNSSTSVDVLFSFTGRLFTFLVNLNPSAGGFTVGSVILAVDPENASFNGEAMFDSLRFT